MLHIAQTLRELSIELVVEEKSNELKCLTRWLQKFEKLVNLSCFFSHGQSGNSDEIAIAFGMPEN